MSEVFDAGKVIEGHCSGPSPDNVNIIRYQFLWILHRDCSETTNTIKYKSIRNGQSKSCSPAAYFIQQLHSSVDFRLLETYLIKVSLDVLIMLTVFHYCSLFESGTFVTQHFRQVLHF